MNEPIEKVNEQCRQIRIALLDSKYKYHKERYSALGIPQKTYYRRLQRIREEDIKDVEDLRRTSLEDRTQRIREVLELVSSINEDIMTDPEIAAKDRTAASAAFLSAEYWIFRAEQAGPHLPQIPAFLNKVKENAIQLSGPTEDTNKDNQ